MDLSLIQNKYEFFCISCGFKKQGPPGYSKAKAYDFLTSKSNTKSKRRSNGFKTKSNRRKQKEQWGDQQNERLEDDPIILANVNHIRSMSLQNNLISPLDKIVNHPEALPVFYEKLRRHDPPLGDKIDTIIQHPDLCKKLHNQGVDILYRFQQESLEKIKSGKNVVISAPTGMGKTEAFLLPILLEIFHKESNPKKRNYLSAIFIYPTKALAQDQLGKIQFYAESMGLSAAKYDGDTSREERDRIFNQVPDIVLTNADMIHYHLNGNIQFQILIRNLRFLVIDEIHLCVGSFGSNVLWIIRRLKRFSPKLQCIGASATVSNAQNFAEEIFDDQVELISAGTARRSDMNLTMLYPTTRSNLSIMADIAQQFVKDEKKTLVFGNGHKSAEVINMILGEKEVKSGIHRAGLNYSYRSRIEQEFKEDKIDALVSTPTLELGIDIGSLDSVVSMLTGLTSFLQRIGRAGRSGQESFATLVLRGDDPISAYYARHPEEYLSDIDPAFVEPNNAFVAKYQILAMVLDKEITESEAQKYSQYIFPLIDEGLLMEYKGRILPHSLSKIRNMLQKYSIRGIGNTAIIKYLDRKIGERSLPMALSELHQSAIYLSGGKTYDVIDYNQDLRVAKVRPSAESYVKTQALRTIKPQVLQIFYETEINGLNAAYCELELTEEVYGYTKSRIFDNKVIERRDLDHSITYTYRTMGFLIALPHPTNLDHLDLNDKEEYLGGTFHAIEHVLIESGNAFSGGGSSQIGGISMGDSGMVFVYDGNEGGSGLSKLLFDSLDRGLRRSQKIMEDCPCKRPDGCPRCTYSYQCGNNNTPLNRIGGIEALKRFGKDNTELYYNFDGLESFVIEPEWDSSWTILNAYKQSIRGRSLNV